jgi:cytochrome P450
MIYNVFFHPLASFPGPWIHGASEWPQQYYHVKGKGCHHIADLHDKYGPVVRFAPNDVSYIKSSAWKEIYAQRSGVPLMRDRKHVQDIQQFGAWNILAADPPDHARQRKQLAPAFSEKALREQEPLITSYVDLLMQRLEETAGQAINLSDLFNFATFDIVGEVSSICFLFTPLRSSRTGTHSK